jgi:hypothetical protein
MNASLERLCDLFLSLCLSYREPPKSRRSMSAGSVGHFLEQGQCSHDRSEGA